MRILWIEIYAEPTRVLCYDVAQLGAHVDARWPRHAILESIDPLNAEAGSDETPQNADCSATTRNKAGQTSRLFAMPPLGAAIAVRCVEDAEDPRTLFSGVCHALSIGESARWEFRA